MRRTRQRRFGRSRARAPGRFVVFAHARSGSTSLVRALERHPDLHILNEPFNETFTRWRPGATEYRSVVTDTASLDTYLEEMYAGHNGIKMLDYQMPREIYTHLLRDTTRKVIWLRRRNIMQSVVSVLISEQTGVWHAWDLDAPVTELQALSIADIRKRIGDLRREIDYYEDVIASRPADMTLRLNYEELYLQGLAEQARQLERVFAFLGVEGPSGAVDVMDPQRTKLNSSRTYALLPNAEQIDAELGCDETGWLFERER